jgi:hypothetical protein
MLAAPHPFLEYCTISTKGSGDGDTHFLLMYAKIALNQKKINRPSRTSKISKLMNLGPNGTVAQRIWGPEHIAKYLRRSATTLFPFQPRVIGETQVNKRPTASCPEYQGKQQ